MNERIVHRARGRVSGLLCAALLAGCGSTTGNTPDSGAGGGSGGAGAPVVIATSPAPAATGVPINSGLAATFSEPMVPATLNASSFTLALGSTAITGAVACADSTATFIPTQPLAASAVYTATIASTAAAVAGGALANSYVWSFTTGASANTTAPTVASTIPSSGATAVFTNTSVSATFSESMSPQTISGATFTLAGPTGVAISGTVLFDFTGKVATFEPAAALAVNTSYVATVHGGPGGVADLNGNLLAASYVWSFTTGARAGLTPVVLGTSANYVLLAMTAISTVPTSAITGAVAVSPAAATALTGFSLVADSTNVFSTSSQVTGRLYAADYAVPTPANLTAAIVDMQAGYTDAAGRPNPDFLNLGAGAIGGLTLAPGLYNWSSTVTIPTAVTLAGSATDVWIFQISGGLTMSAAVGMILSGGAKSSNIFWQVAGAVDIGANAHFEGIILSHTSVSLQTGASMNGRALAQAQIALQEATVTEPAL